MNLRRFLSYVPKRLVIFGIIVTFTVFYIKDHLIGHHLLYVTHNLVHDVESADKLEENYLKNLKHDGSEYILHTDHCKIKNLHPFDPSIKSLVYGHKPEECIKNVWLQPLTHLKNGILSINSTIESKYFSTTLRSVRKCQYREIIRPKGDDFNIKYGKPVTFSKSVAIKNEFIFVVCYNILWWKLYENFHSQIIKRPKKLRKDNDKRLNVLLLGIDSMSRLNMLRHMNTLHKILKDNGAIEMKALNKVAMNTLVNLTPMLTGKFLNELPHMSVETPFDDYPYIWRNFSSSGYATLESEDAMMAFNYLAGGFKNPPTDHYTRPFMLAADYSELYKNSASKICLGPKTRIQILLEYLNDFIKTYENIPHWALMFLSSASHNYANDVSRVSHLYEKFIRNSLKSGVFKNTLLIFFSDHGIRFGPLRATSQGWFEDRMPFMFLWFPQWFRDENPDLMDNLRTNSERLITFFDVYETLKDVLKFKPTDITNRKIGIHQRGISLFNEVPLNRTCMTAQIPFEYCACSFSTDNELSKDIAKKGANFIVEHLNKLIAVEAHHCAKLKLKQIIDAKKLDYENGYLILLTVKVTPSAGIFEGILKVHRENRNSMTLKGDINRINKYGKQSHCVQTRSIREFCMCKDLVS